ncbi:MAG TPA: hypothetical protein VMG31_11900, partial [Verrucomicrobiae bacterium]|nr:hypothetical protein [Verrucomicrobiae bacterium]
MWEALLKFCLDSASLPDKQRHDLIHGVPILFTANVQKELERAASNLPPESAAKVKPVLQELSDLRTRYEEQKEEYPIGLGPIEKIFRQVRDGEISEQEGEHQAVEPRVVLSLGPLYVQALSAFNLTTAREGQWRDAALMQKLLVLALKTFERTGSMGDALPNAVLNWIEIVHVYVYQLPDPRLFRNAIEEGEALIAAQKDGNDALVGEVSHRLGTLHLDPYAARNSLHYDTQMSQWRQRFYDSVGPAIAQLASADRDMPEPLVALAKAEDYLRRAAKLRTGTRRGQSLKALAQAIQWQVILGKEDRKEDFVRACTEAMQALAPQESPQEWVSVLNMRGAGASPEERETLDRILSTSWDSHVAKIGMRYTLDLISQSAQFFYNNDAPERCLR